MSAPDAAYVAALIGRVVAGKYQLEAVIGSGAMGTVFRARQVSLEKAVALKVLHPSLRSDSTFVERFHREAKAASSLDHPNSVAILDYGESGDLLYIAMEFLDGRDLFDVIASESPLPRTRIIDLLRQTLAAVAAAHELGIVHRDLKPENIMVLRRRNDDGDWSDLVKVCDFGVAKMSDRGTTLRPNEARPNEPEVDSKAPRRHLSMQGALIGTPEYMSPEQAKGEPLDLRSDLYAVGVILYQLLTGKVPFEGASALEVALKHLTAEPKPPTEVALDVDPGLEAVCLKAMTKDRNLRYQTARQMRNALRAVLHGLPAGTDWADATGVFPSMPGGLDSVVPPAVSSALSLAAARAPAASFSEIEPPASSGDLHAAAGAGLAVAPSDLATFAASSLTSAAARAHSSADLMYFASDLPKPVATRASVADLNSAHAARSNSAAAPHGDNEAIPLVKPSSPRLGMAEASTNSAAPPETNAPLAAASRSRAPGARSTPFATSQDSAALDDDAPLQIPKQRGTVLYFLAPAVIAAAATLWFVTNGKPASVFGEPSASATGSASPNSGPNGRPKSSASDSVSGDKPATALTTPTTNLRGPNAPGVGLRPGQPGVGGAMPRLPVAPAIALDAGPPRTPATASAHAAEPIAPGMPSAAVTAMTSPPAPSTSGSSVPTAPPALSAPPAAPPAVTMPQPTSGSPGAAIDHSFSM